MLVVGGGVDRAGGWDAAVRLAERVRAPVWEAPAPERVSFPQTHRLFQGSLPPGMKPLAERLAGHDVVLLAGAQVFRYHPHIPGPILPPGTRLLHLTDDPDEAARAAAGFSIVGDVRVGLERLAELVPDADRPGPSPRPAPGAPPPTEPMSVGYVFRALASALPRTRWLSKSQYRAALPSTTRFASSGRHPTSPPAAVVSASPYRPRSASDWPGRARRGLHRRRWVDDVRRPCHLDRGPT